MAILRIIILIYILFGILLTVRQDAYLFLPPSQTMEECAEFQDAKIITSNGTKAFLLSLGTSSPLAVMYHGNGENACDSASFAHWIHGMGYTVLSVEYAGYAGDAERSPSVKLLKQDVENIHAWVTTSAYTETLIIGRSIGTGFASYHASLVRPEKLLLISPFDTLSKVASGHFPVYPASLLLKTDFNNVLNASSAERILLIHGTKDVIIPITHGKTLLTSLPQQEKLFIQIEGAGHNDVLDHKEAWDAMKSFIEKP